MSKNTKRILGIGVLAACACILAYAQSTTVVIKIPGMTATNVNNTVQVTTLPLRFRTLVVAGERGPGTNNTDAGYVQFSAGGTNTVPGIQFGVWPNETLQIQFGPNGYVASNLWLRFDNTNDGAAIYLLQ